MADRFDRAVAGLLGAAALTCAGAAALFRPAPLPAEDAARWVQLAQRSGGDQHLFRRTWQIDAIDAGAQHLSYTEHLPPVRRGEAFAVTGWALDPVGRRTARALEYRLDGGAWRRARYGLPRPDVAIALNLNGSADAGFTATVPTGALARGPHELEFATDGAHGRARMRPTVRFEVAR